MIKPWVEKLLVLLLFLLCITVGCRDSAKLAPRIPEARPRSSPAPNPNMTGVGEIVEQEHPYGRKVQGGLIWEGDPRFLEKIAANHLTTRLAAFQTTLPDPLPGEEANVALAADLLAGKVVQPGAVFSMNRSLGPYSRGRGFREGPAYAGSIVIKTTGGGVCKIASTLYNVTILADLKVVERHSHSMQVPYVPPGQDATVSTGTKDFRLQNTTGKPIMFWADTKGNTLFMAIYGQTQPPSVIWHHQILERWPTRTIYRKNPRLKPGESKVAVPGAEGLAVKSWLTVKYHDGRVERRELGTDHYRPLPHVIEKG